MLIGIISRRVPDEVKNLDSNLLQDRLDAIIKLGLTYCHSLEPELQLGLNKQCLDVVWPERRHFHSYRVEKVGGRESGRNFLEDGSISRHSKQLKETLSSKQSSLTYVSLYKKQGGRERFQQELKQNKYKLKINH